MAIAYVAPSSNASDSGVSSINIPKPTGTADNDILFLIASIGSSQNFTTPSGWTMVDSVAGSSVNTALWYKVASSEGSSYTLSWTGGVSAVTAGMSVYRGADTTAPINVSGESSSSGRTITGPTVTTTANCWMIYTRTTRISSGTKTDLETTWPSATERVDSQFDVSGGVGHGVSLADSNGPTSAGSQSGAASSSAASSPTENVLRTVGLKVLNPNVSVDAGLASVSATAFDAEGAPGVFTTAGLASALVGVWNADATLVWEAFPGNASATATAFNASVRIHADIGRADVVVNVQDKGVYYGAPSRRTFIVGAEGRTTIVTY